MHTILNHSNNLYLLPVGAGIVQQLILHLSVDFSEKLKPWNLSLEQKRAALRSVRHLELHLYLNDDD